LCEFVTGHTRTPEVAATSSKLLLGCPAMRRGVLVSLVVAISLIVPAAASAAPSASFYKATGGSFGASVHAGGLSISASSPAYLVVRYSSSSTPDLERYAKTNTFAAVGVTNGNRTDCFVGAQVMTGRGYVSDFTDAGVRYHGLVITYTRHFRLNTSQTAQCKAKHAPGAILPTVSLSKSSAKLSVTCMIKYCNGKFAAFKPPSACRGPVRLLPGVVGCSPAYNGFFKVPGGLTDKLTIPLKGTSASVERLVLVVNGKTVLSSKISALRRTPKAPSRPKTSSIWIACAAGAVGSPADASGRISPSGRGTVSVTFTGPTGSSPVTANVNADASGKWKASFTPTTVGAGSVRAAFIGDRSRKAAVSSACPFHVVAH
jgi:hypothetical protein